MRKGEIIAVLENPVLQEEIEAARAGVEIVEAQLKKAKNDGTEAEVELAEAQLKQAEANLRTYEAQEKETKIVSPIEGVVFSVPVSPGEVINAGDTVAVIGNLKELKLVVYLSEEKEGRVRLVITQSFLLILIPGGLLKVGSQK